MVLGSWSNGTASTYGSATNTATYYDWNGNAYGYQYDDSNDNSDNYPNKIV